VRNKLSPLKTPKALKVFKGGKNSCLFRLDYKTDEYTCGKIAEDLNVTVEGVCIHIY